jgi:uncharacterized protein YegL
VCILADNSGSMRGRKAEAATRGLREMLLNCQMKGPRGQDRSYYRFVLIRFGSHAELDKSCYLKPVREIDPNTIEIRGDGGGTNITEALELAYRGLSRFVKEMIEPHPERERYPLPLVLLFSDGHNGGHCPLGIAEQIKELNVDGDPVLIAAASVWVDDSMPPDGNLLREIATPGCYVDIDRPESLTEFLSATGSSGASSPAELARLMEKMQPETPPRVEYQAAAALPAPKSANGGGGGKSGRRRRKRRGRGGQPSSELSVPSKPAPPSVGAFGLGD